MENVTSLFNEGRAETPFTYRTVGRALNKNDIYAKM